KAPLFDRIDIRQIGDNQPPPGLQDSVQFLQRLIIKRDMFQNAGSNHRVENGVRIGQTNGVPELLVTKTGELMKHPKLFTGGDIATIQVYLVAAMQPDQA